MRKEDLRIIFFGTPDFAVESLAAIYDAGYDVRAVVTMPDKIAGRGHKLIQSPVKEWAVTNGLPVLQPVSLKDPSFIESLKNLKANLFIVIAFRMLPEMVWAMPELGTFNLHASLLPAYRGAAPINWAIINGEKETGVTTFFLKHEIDTGDVICRSSVEIADDEDAGSLHDRLMKLGAEVTLHTLEQIVKGTLKTEPQTEVDGIRKSAPKIFHDTCFIDWNKSSREIYNFVRGLSPYPAARANLRFPKTEEAEYKIFAVLPANGKNNLKPGEVSVAEGKIYIGTGEGAIEITSLQAPGKKRLTAKEFINGLRR